ncbi:hypothetical protein QBC43DRAFT_369517 [Cladorrhinum sp. PSN259]|nr:hypothetical protein QBC43DRAFT_369517 [Cladorrhinum sp. PSN259]
MKSPAPVVSGSKQTGKMKITPSLSSLTLLLLSLIDIKSIKRPNHTMEFDKHGTYVLRGSIHVPNDRVRAMATRAAPRSTPATEFSTVGCAINCKDAGPDGCFYDEPVIIPCGCTDADVNVLTTTICAWSDPCVQCMTEWGAITVNATTCGESGKSTTSTFPPPPPPPPPVASQE